MVRKVITATSPCLRFIDLPLQQQHAKLREEVNEVFEALCDYEENPNNIPKCVHLIEELLDVQVCLNTMLEQLTKAYGAEFYNKCRISAEEIVIQKNLARGYYAEDVSE